MRKVIIVIIPENCIPSKISQCSEQTNRIRGRPRRPLSLWRATRLKHNPVRPFRLLSPNSLICIFSRTQWRSSNVRSSIVATKSAAGAYSGNHDWATRLGDTIGRGELGDTFALMEVSCKPTLIHRQLRLRRALDFQGDESPTRLDPSSSPYISLFCDKRTRLRPFHASFAFYSFAVRVTKVSPMR